VLSRTANPRCGKVKGNVKVGVRRTPRATHQTQINRYKLMWKGEFLRWAQTYEGSFLDDEAAQKKWEAYCADPSITRQTMDGKLWLWVLVSSK
jgi:hypothetical protein